MCTFGYDTSYYECVITSWLILFSLHRVLTADMPFIYGITNSSDTIPTEHLTDTTGMVKQIYGKDYEPDTDYEHPSERKVVEKPKVEKPKEEKPKPVMNKLKKKDQKPKADDKEAAAAKKDGDEDHLEL